MRILRPDPNAETAAAAASRFRSALVRSAWAVVVLWGLWLIDLLLPVDARGLGVRPGAIPGLIGIPFMPLIHGGAAHLIANTWPLLLLGTAIQYFYPGCWRRRLPWFWLLPGLGVWWIGQAGSVHYGASGLNFALLGYLMLGGLLRREAATLALSLLVMFLYGGMLSGVLPIKEGVSWEGHLCGLLVGLFLAVLDRRRDLPPPRRYDYEDDEEFGLDEEADGAAVSPEAGTADTEDSGQPRLH